MLTYNWKKILKNNSDLFKEIRNKIELPSIQILRENQIHFKMA